MISLNQLAEMVMKIAGKKIEYSGVPYWGAWKKF